MNYRLLYLISFILIISCQTKPQEDSKFQEIIEEGYELAIPNEPIKGVMVLFGGYPEQASDIKREFDILEKAIENDVAILYSNFNQKIWLEQLEIETLAFEIKQALENYKLPRDNLYIGGFSSGGNVAVFLSNYLAGNTQVRIMPRGVFLVDSPINLKALYDNAELNIKRDFSEVSVEEANWLLQKFENTLGNPEDSVAKFEQYSVYTLQNQNVSNLRNLKNTKIRLYTEPDSLWWKENRQTDFVNTNAYQIQELAKVLKQNEFEKVEYLPSHQKGYRSNGIRHPHSWSIINQDDLLDWMLNP